MIQAQNSHNLNPQKHIPKAGPTQVNQLFLNWSEHEDELSLQAGFNYLPVIYWHRAFLLRE